MMGDVDEPAVTPLTDAAIALLWATMPLERYLALKAWAQPLDDRAFFRITGC